MGKLKQIQHLWRGEVESVKMCMDWSGVDWTVERGETKQAGHLNINDKNNIKLKIKRYSLSLSLSPPAIIVFVGHFLSFLVSSLHYLPYLFSAFHFKKLDI